MFQLSTTTSAPKPLFLKKNLGMYPQKCWVKFYTIIWTLLHFIPTTKSFSPIDKELTELLTLKSLCGGVGGDVVGGFQTIN